MCFIDCSELWSMLQTVIEFTQAYDQVKDPDFDIIWTQLQGTDPVNALQDLSSCSLATHLHESRDLYGI